MKIAAAISFSFAVLALQESFVVEALDSFVWKPDSYSHQGGRGDIVNKDVLLKAN